jgi:hypothetical protein
VVLPNGPIKLFTMLTFLHISDELKGVMGVSDRTSMHALS